MIRIRILALALFAALVPVQPLLADDDRHESDDDGHEDRAEDWAPEFKSLKDSAYRIIPLKRAVEIATQRFNGRVIAARLSGPSAHDREHGVVLVHELRLLTPDRDVLRIRLDARSGDFLEVAGAGLTRARRKGQQK